MKADLLDNEKLSRKDYGPDDRFDFPIGYGGALLGHDGQGHIELVYRWELGKYCHSHRHLCEVRSAVLQGSLEVITFEHGVEASRFTRQAGSYSHMPEGDVHVERGGPDCATVLFNLYSPDGRSTQMLDEQGNTLKTLTIETVPKQFAN